MSAKPKSTPLPSLAEYDGVIARVNGLLGITPAVLHPNEGKSRANLNALRRWCADEQDRQRCADRDAEGLKRNKPNELFG